MTISSSLNAGVAGLASNASRLATISDNIANSATYGYKRVETDFHSMVTTSGGAAYSAGGVRTSNQRLIDERGTIISTSNSTDLAVRGRGFLPVTSTGSLGGPSGAQVTKLVTTGSFRMDKDGYFVTKGGLALLGWAANADGTLPEKPRDSFAGLSPVRVNLNEYVGSPTTEITIAANLPATDTRAGAIGTDRQLSVEYFDNLSTSQTLTINFSPVPNPAPPATPNPNKWTMTVLDSAAAVGSPTIASLDLAFNGTPGGGGRLQSAVVTTPSVPPPGVTPTYVPATGILKVQVGDGQEISINMGKYDDPGALSQIADKFAPGTVAKDGFPPASLAGIEVTEKGELVASFENGMQRTISYIPLVDVPNPNGLSVNDDQTYRPSMTSGQFMLWKAGDGTTGGIRSYAREESATDVAGELTQLIRTQRAYSSNAKVIQTVDEMMQETTNMKR